MTSAQSREEIPAAPSCRGTSQPVFLAPLLHAPRIRSHFSGPPAHRVSLTRRGIQPKRMLQIQRAAFGVSCF